MECYNTYVWSLDFSMKPTTAAPARCQAHPRWTATSVCCRTPRLICIEVKGWMNKWNKIKVSIFVSGILLTTTWRGVNRFLASARWNNPLSASMVRTAKSGDSGSPNNPLSASMVRTNKIDDSESPYGSPQVWQIRRLGWLLSHGGSLWSKRTIVLSMTTMVDWRTIESTTGETHALK
jgi:hypothetical protein